MLPLVRAFDAKAVDAGLAEKPELISCRDERQRNWLHICCATKLQGRDPKLSVRTADVLMARGIDIHDHAFTEGKHWKATPVWFAVAHGQNFVLAKHLLKLGASPQHSLFAAAYNHDIDAIKLLVEFGADIEDNGSSPFLGAIAWSHFAEAEALAKLGANVDAQDGKGRTAAHLMLKKGSDYEHFAMLKRLGARFDISDAEGATASSIMTRKKDKRFHALAGAGK